jgi:hypothetical protein
MALVNPNIAMSFRQPDIQAPNALAQYAQIQQIQGGRQAQELNALKMQEAQNAFETRNNLRGLDFSAPDYVSQVARYDPKLASEIAKERATIAAQDANRKEAEFKLTAQRRKFGDDLLRNLSSNPSDENVVAWGQDAVIQNLYTKDQAERTVRQILAMKPEDRVAAVSQSGASSGELKPSLQQINREGQTDLLRVNPFSGAPTSIGTFADVPLPAAVEAQKVRIGNASAARQITNVNTMLPASEEAQKEFIKESRVTHAALKQAPVVLDNIDKAKALVSQAKGFMGAGGESVLQAASFLNNRLGTNIDTKGVTSAEELRSRLFLGILDNLKKLDSQPSQQQQAALQVALGSIGTDPTALPRVLDVFAETVRQKVDLYNEEVQSAEGRGVKFPYNPVIKLPSRPTAPAPGTPAPGTPAPAAAAARPAGVGANWTFERDAAGNTAWVSPDRKSFKEAK